MEAACAMAGAVELLPRGDRPGHKSQSSMWGKVASWGCNVLMNSRSITKSSVKRETANALADVQRSMELSKNDLADLLGCSYGTIVNRLDGDSPDCQMTIYELVRGIRELGPTFGNAVLLPQTGYLLTKSGGDEVCPSEVKLTTSKALTQLLELLDDNDLSDADAQALAPILVKLIGKYQAIVAKAFAASGRVA